MASARVGSQIRSCHVSTGYWLVTRVDRAFERSSRISRRSVAVVLRERGQKEDFFASGFPERIHLEIERF